MDNPEEIWAHAFEEQLSLLCQDVLRVMTTMSAGTSLVSLEPAFNAFYVRRCADNGIARSPGAFRRAMKELEGTFIQLRKISNGCVVEFSNPSIRDFMQILILKDPDLLSLMESAVFYEQVAWMSATRNNRKTRLPVSGLKKNRTALLEKMIELFAAIPKEELFRIDYREGDKFVAGKPNIGDRLADILEENYDQEDEMVSFVIEEQLVSFSKGIAMRQIILDESIESIARMNQFEAFTSNGGAMVVAAIKALAAASIDNLEGFERIRKLIDELPDMFSESERLDISGEFDVFAEKYFEDLMESGLDDPSEFRSAADRFERVGEFFSVDTSESVRAIKDVADQREQDAEPARNWEPDERKTSGHLDHFSNSELDSMFRTLNE